jgi:SAM-dependent methyltransferase
MITQNSPFFARFRELMNEAAKQEPVYDIGTSGRFAKEMAFVKDLFKPESYKAACGPTTDEVVRKACDMVADAQNLSEIASGSVGSVISLEVLEHVEHPEKVVQEAFRVLKSGGVCVLSTPFVAGYHGKSDHDSYRDFWRFTHEGLQYLFQQAGFSSVEVFPVNGPIACRLEMMKLGWLANLVGRFEKPRLGKLTTRHFVKAVK